MAEGGVGGIAGLNGMLRSIPLLLLWSVHAAAGTTESVCFGTPSQGRLEGGVQLQESGSNFSPHSSLGVSLGRTHVHSKVAEVVIAAYKTLAQSTPDKVFLYGESGWASGGRFRPHRTHQNGLSVDFMVPVLDAEGRSITLPTSPFNKFGYGIEFDGTGHYDGLTIDFEAIAEHLHALHLAAKQQGIGIARVIFDPVFIPRLHDTKWGAFIKENISFLQGRVWIRHDEHYHIDFSVPCKPFPG